MGISVPIFTGFPNSTGVDIDDLVVAAQPPGAPLPHSTAWTFDPVDCQGAKSMSTGIIYVTMLKVWEQLPLGPTGTTQLHTFANTQANATNNSAMALYGSVGSPLAEAPLIGVTGDLSVTLQGSWSAGITDLVIGNLAQGVVIAPGVYYIIMWQNGTTAANLWRAGNANAPLSNWPNPGITAGNFIQQRGWRQAGAPAGLVPPSSISPSGATLDVPWWAGIQQT